MKLQRQVTHHMDFLLSILFVFADKLPPCVKHSAQPFTTYI
jgi:hypothetical protein